MVWLALAQAGGFLEVGAATDEPDAHAETGSYWIPGWTIYSVSSQQLIQYQRQLF